jgi:starch-binding outer membrane protein, SusD/RagB family
MMKNMKSSIFSYLLIITMVLSSCKKKLDLNPTDRVDATVAKQNVDLMMLGAYSLIGAGGIVNSQEGALYGTDLLLNADLLASENYMQWRGTFNNYTEVSEKSISVTNTNTVRMWRKAYMAINLCNTILENLSGLSAEDAALYKGQALFIRGTMFFELLRFYGEPSTQRGIPLVLKSTESFESIVYPSRASIDSTYAQVLADLKLGKSLLPDDNESYADKYTVAAMLSRVYLYKEDYANALAEANEVINSGKYTLPTSVEAAFNTSASSEAIFEILQTTQNNAGTTNDGITTFYGCDFDIPGSASRGDVQIDSVFINKYDSLDKRKSLLIYAGSCNKQSITSGKWKNPYTNISVIRLSEMYLIRAEANVRLGSSLGASPLDDINAIRSKASTILYADVDLDKVLLERELELAFEGVRIHDFKRIKKVVAINDSTNIDYTGDEFIFPIPLSEINVNKNLIQNSYYQ